MRDDSKSPSVQDDGRTGAVDETRHLKKPSRFYRCIDDESNNNRSYDQHYQHDANLLPGAPLEGKENIKINKS